MDFTLDFRLPKEVNNILNQLNDHGLEAYVVGGCVRDCILGKAPKDWDITTNAAPELVKTLFAKTVDTGIKHGTVTVVIDHTNYEVTTYRVDGDYTDNRRPSSVAFTSSLEDDLGRRDFTMNAIAYHPRVGFVDPFCGIEDIRKKSIQAVGQAEKRFGEDALRMLRAVRFSAQLGFTIEKETFESIKHCADLIQNISHERVRDELTKTLISDHPLKFILFRDTKLLQYILPEIEVCFHTGQNHPYHIYNVGVHSLNAVMNIEIDKVLRWTMLLHDIGKPAVKTTDADDIDHFFGHQMRSMQMAKMILCRLRFDNKTIEKVCRLIQHHDRDIEPSYRSVRRAVQTVGDDIFPDLIKVKEADNKAQNPEYIGKRLEKLGDIKAIYADIKEKQQCTNLKDLAVDGNDLINAGFPTGKDIGMMLNKLLKAVIENPDLNSRETLIGLAKRQ